MSEVGSDRPLRAVALGGGHGLHAALSALRTVTTDLTAVVTVADDGGSSGRIRRELKVLPPGDLRMALAALAGTDPDHQQWTQLLQHRPSHSTRSRTCWTRPSACCGWLAVTELCSLVGQWAKPGSDQACC